MKRDLRHRLGYNSLRPDSDNRVSGKPGAVHRFYEQFSDQVQVQHRFIPIFGNARHRISTLWAAIGGFDGFNQHLRAIHEQFDHIDELGIPRRDIQPFLDDGRALAGLYEDSELQHENKIEGSPTFVINEGRQKLYGDVGYKITEANIHELLSEPNQDQASWC